MRLCLLAWLAISFCACGDNASTGESAPDSVGASDAASDDTTSDDEDVAARTHVLPTFDVSAVDFPECTVDEAAIDALMEALGRAGQIGQHLMFGVNGSGSEIDETAAAMIATYQPGGVFMGPPLGIAVGDPTKTARIVRSAQVASVAASGVPLLVSLDQEGGPNSAVNSVTGGTDTLGSLPTGASLDAAIAFDQFSIMGREIAAMGFNMALAPVLDTLTSTRNGNLNTRAFSPIPELNAVLGLAAMAGFQRHGVIAVGKHFPGDGLSSDNPHTTQVSVDVDRETLDATLLVPFKAAIDGGIDGMMTMPARFTALDPERSAIISRKVTTDVLRGELGFEGLVVTDSLGMVGATLGLPEGQSEGLTALQAGADVLLEVVMLDEDAAALVAEIDQALETGTLDVAEFEASTRRILRTKQRYCLFESPGLEPGEIDPAVVSGAVGLEESRLQMAAHAHEALVLVHDDGVLPLTGQRVLYVGPDTLFQDPGSTWLNVVDQTMADALRNHDPSVEHALWTLAPAPASLVDEALTLIDLMGADVLVLGTLQGRFSLEQQQVVEWLLDSVEMPVVHVMLGVPFDYFQTRGRVDAALAVMGSRSVMVEAAAEVLYGVAEAGGTMLYDLSEERDEVSISGGSDPQIDRCEAEGIVCAGQGVCVDTGTTYGCVCHPNWHPSDDGLDCIPDGQ